jgi:hypothetical protein
MADSCKHRGIFHQARDYLSPMNDSSPWDRLQQNIKVILFHSHFVSAQFKIVSYVGVTFQ